MNTKNYRIRILYDVVGWAYYHRAVALQKYAPSNYIVDIGSDYGKSINGHDYDLILQLAYSYIQPLKSFLKNAKKSIPVISSYNVGWGYCNNWLTNVINSCEGVIINNYEMWDKYGRHPKTVHISNGADRSVFNIKTPIEKRRQRILWIGSIFHRRTKNYDSILIPISQRLKRQGVSVDFRLVDSTGRNRMSQDQMNWWYNSGSIYVVASQTEGTPNPAIESSWCGCIPVSTRVGNMPELIHDGVNGYLCDTNIDSIYNNILLAMKNYKKLSTNMQTEIVKWDWKYKAKKYFDYFDSIIGLGN